MRYALATRPAFLAVTGAACAIGLSSALADGVPIDMLKAIVTVVFALAAHAGANVLNDYYDSRSGNDAANTERLFPYTGGSRFIQDGLLTERETLALGSALIAATMAAGLWLMATSAPGLFFFGAAGLFIAVGYSAPPFSLASRGLGEAAIWIAWMLVATGTDFVQRAHASPLPWFATASYALLVANVLFINQFPDRRTDEAVGKRHWVVRLGSRRAADAYLTAAIVAHLVVLLGVALRELPALAMIALFSLPASLHAANELRHHHAKVSELVPAIRSTIAAALLHGALVVVALLLG